MRRTQSKLGRMYSVELKDGHPIIERRAETLPPAPRSQLVFMHKDMVIAETVSDGQRINPEKAYKRAMDRKSAITVHDFCRLLSNLFGQQIMSDKDNNLTLEDDTVIPAAEWVDGVNKSTFEKYDLKAPEVEHAKETGTIIDAL